MTKLSAKQIEVLERGATGVSIRYETLWMLDGQPVTRTAKSLIKRGLAHAMYFSGGRAALNATSEGRAALAALSKVEG